MLVIAALGSGAYLALFFSHVPGATDERLGGFEPLPPHLGQWQTVDASSEDGLVREERYLFRASGSGGAGTVTFQVRYRDPNSREIVRIEPEVVTKRRRAKTK